MLFREETPYLLPSLTMSKEPSFLRYCEIVMERKQLSKGPVMTS